MIKLSSLAYDIYKKTNNNDEKYNWFLAEKILYLKFIDEIDEAIQVFIMFIFFNYNSLTILQSLSFSITNTATLRLVLVSLSKGPNAFELPISILHNFLLHEEFIPLPKLNCGVCPITMPLIGVVLLVLFLKFKYFIALWNCFSLLEFHSSKSL